MLRTGCSVKTLTFWADLSVSIASSHHGYTMQNELVHEASHPRSTSFDENPEWNKNAQELRYFI